MLPPFPVFTERFHSSVYSTIDPTNPKLSASGKVILVTGGNKGVGRAIATAFALAGARAVLILGRSVSSLEDASQEISSMTEAAGLKKIIRFFSVDICDYGAVCSAFKKVRQEVGPVDVLITSAGELYQNTIDESSADDYWKSFEINVKGMFNCMQALLHFGIDKNATNPSTMVNISTIGIAMTPTPGWSAYAASKLAAWNMVEHLSMETSGRLRVFSVHPGRISTDMSKKAGIPTGDDKELPGAFCVWLATTPAADFLQGRLVACNWDVDELLEMRQEIVEKDLLKMRLTGWNA